MPNNNWSFRLVLAIFSLIGLIFAGASPVTADGDDGSSAWPTGCVAADSSTPGDGFTAPAPCKIDASGVDQDQYYIPADFDHPVQGAGGGYYVNGNGQVPGLHKTEGARTVTVTTSDNSGTWTFSYSDVQTGEEAKNKYRIVLGETCKKEIQGSTRYRDAVAYVTNRDDLTEFTFSVSPEVIDVRGLVSVIDTEIAYNIIDGDTAAMRLMESDDGIRGLRPGVYRVKFWQSRDDRPWEGKVAKRMKLTVPACGKVASVGPGSGQARGDLKRLGCRVKAVADVRGFTLAPKARYELVRKPFGKRARHGSFAVPAGQKRSFVVKRLGHARVVLTLKVKQPTGKWVKLDRVIRPRCR